MNLRVSNETSGLSPLDDSLSNDTRENPTDNPSYAFAEVVTLKYPHRYINNTGLQCSRNSKTKQNFYFSIFIFIVQRH